MYQTTLSKATGQPLIWIKTTRYLWKKLTRLANSARKPSKKDATHRQQDSCKTTTRNARQSIFLNYNELLSGMNRKNIYIILLFSNRLIIRKFVIIIIKGKVQILYVFFCKICVLIISQCNFQKLKSFMAGTKNN